MNQDILEKVWDLIDSARVCQTLIDMVDIYSPSGKEEDIQLYIQGRLEADGLAVTRQIVEDERYNLFATMGAGIPKLILVGHVDTVPAWNLDEYGAEEEWGVVRGLGAADMKGGCAAMLEAWLALAALQPTSLSPCLSHYGYLEVALTTQGRRIHSSLPELGHNAVESMLRFLLLLGNEPLFQRDSTQIVYSIREMSSSRAGFVVPDQCETYIDLHLPPGMSPESVQQAIRACVAKAEGLIQGFNLSLSFDFSSQGYALDECSDFTGILEDVYTQLNQPLRFSPFRSHSDGNLFFGAGCRPMILGPGSLETAHTADEQTSLSEVEAAARIYAALCLSCAD